MTLYDTLKTAGETKYSMVYNSRLEVNHFAVSVVGVKSLHFW